MAILILGLVIFIGVHSIRLVSPSWRDAQVARLGEQGWKGLYSIASIVGFVLIVWGYGVARRTPMVLWMPPLGIRHLTALLVLISFVLIAAAYVPGNRIKRMIGHPMMVGVAIWALGHLLANGTLNAIVLFGVFLVWGAVGAIVSRSRDRAAGVQYPTGTVSGDAKVVIVGLIAWAIFAFALHRWLIGVSPLA
ncbi:NnrU family protein [Trinickia dinghuensis]|uniref:NnrU family protein n=1 Tax=Trinickia dinghuensis TaxID=2291023 RepID=A0A3D8K065_9BURK|nr:NnrU family protein [Trinickia dinghuensis]RDU98639.1 NnrU family protein [Trinickia dinghuensis]